MRRKRWTLGLATAAALAAVSGGAMGLQGAMAGPGDSGRPHPSYYCYDCHGNRYFDPYYDWCAGYGFRFSWSRHPGLIGVYRSRYLRIREAHPEYGRYRYRAGYRETRRYREPKSYEAWRSGIEGRGGVREKLREHGSPAQGSDGSHKKGRERTEHRGGTSRGSLREGA